MYFCMYKPDTYNQTSTLSTEKETQMWKKMAEEKRERDAKIDMNMAYSKSAK